MNKEKIINLIRLQIFVSFLFNNVIRLIDISKIFCFTTLTIILMVYFNFWPEKNSFKTLFIIVWISLNSFFFFKKLKNSNKNKKFTIFSMIEIFQKKLKLKNDELKMILDNLLTGRSLLWTLACKQNLERIKTNYEFKIKYFFLLEKTIPINYFATVLGWLCIFFYLSNEEIYNNLTKSITPQTTTNVINEPGMNVWIYPPKHSKKDLVYFEKDKNYDEISQKSIFVENGSKILINFHNVNYDKVRINFNNKKISNKQNLDKIDFKTLKFESLLSDGYYSIIINNKTFYKFFVTFDKSPQINYISLPKINNQSVFSFSYKLLDENNKKSWLEIGSSFNKSFKQTDFEKFEKVFSKPSHFITLENTFELEKKKSIEFEFSKDLSYLPLFGKNLFLRLGSIDQNNQLGFSKEVSLNVPKFTFLDPLANELIKLRDELFDNEKFNQTINKLEKLDKFKNYELVNKRINDLILLLKKEGQSNFKLENSLIEFWRIASYIENNSIQALLKKITVLKDDLKKLLENNGDQNKIDQKTNQLEILLEKYNSLNKFEQNQVTIGELDEIDNEQAPSKKNRVIKNSRAKNLIAEVERLLKKDKNSEQLAKNIISNLKKIYKMQKVLIGQSYENSENSQQKNKLELKQIEIISLYNSIKEKLMKFLPNDDILINDISIFMEKANRLITVDKISQSIESQIEVIEGLKEIYNKLKENSRKSKEKQLDNRDKVEKRGTGNTNEIEIPLIFETNNFNKIIEKIRSMSGEENRDIKEKNYLKSLLPDF